LIPYNQSLKLFYLNYLPYITIILFVFTTIFLLNPKNKLEYFIVTLAILNPSTLLQIERFNNDIFIFFILIIIAFNRIYIFNWLLFYYCFLFKLYPIVSGSFVFIENKNRSTVSLLILVAFLGVVSLYFLLNDYFPFLNTFGTISKPGYWHLFTLNTIPKVLKYFGLNYIFCLILVYSAFFYMTYKAYISQQINSQLLYQLSYRGMYNKDNTYFIFTFKSKQPR
jgi:hypothetical protein